MTIYNIENTIEIGNPVRVFDANGKEIERVIECDTETGRVKELLTNSNTWVESHYPAPLRVEPIAQTKQFIVGHIDWMNNELILEKIVAADWQSAVVKHSKYPFNSPDSLEHISPTELGGNYPELSPEESFRQCCFDCDCMMNWIEV